MSRWDDWHILTGRSLIRVGGDDLESTPELWEALWRDNADRLLAVWIAERPGERPPVWWEASCPDDGPADGESEPEYLWRLGLIGDAEVDAIRAKVQSLIAFNRHRDPTRPGSNFIPPDDVARFAAKVEVGLLDDEERAILRLA
jgi:hypothetical protein